MTRHLPAPPPPEDGAPPPPRAPAIDDDAPEHDPLDDELGAFDEPTDAIDETLLEPSLWPDDAEVDLPDVPPPAVELDFAVVSDEPEGGDPWGDAASPPLAEPVEVDELAEIPWRTTVVLRGPIDRPIDAECDPTSAKTVLEGPGAGAPLDVILEIGSIAVAAKVERREAASWRVKVGRDVLAGRFVVRS